MRTIGASVESIESGTVTLTVCEGTVFDATRTRVLAKMTATMMAIELK